MITPLPVLLLSDDRPGHFNLAEGILAAASRLRPLAIERLTVRRGRWPGRIVAAWSNRAMAPDQLLRVVYGVAATQLSPAALVVSAGAETLGANVAIARHMDARNIFYGSLRHFDVANFDLNLTSYPAMVTARQQAFALKPSLAATAARRLRAGPPRSPPTSLALLIGGPSGESTFTDADWTDLFKLIELAAASGLRWRASNSRRTPPAVSDRLAEMAASAGPPLVQFEDVRRPGITTLAALLASADAAFVTDDSSSMVTDAVASGLPVIGAAPRSHALTANELDYRGYLTQNGWYRSRSLAGMTVATLLDELAVRTPLHEDPEAILSALLAERLPQLFKPVRP